MFHPVMTQLPVVPVVAAEAGAVPRAAAAMVRAAAKMADRRARSLVTGPVAGTGLADMTTPFEDLRSGGEPPFQGAETRWSAPRGMQPVLTGVSGPVRSAGQTAAEQYWARAGRPGAKATRPDHPGPENPGRKSRGATRSRSCPGPPAARPARRRPPPRPGAGRAVPSPAGAARPRQA